MNIWFIIDIVLNAMSIGLHLAKHGEPRDGEYNFWGALIGATVNVLIVYMAIKGGF